MQDAKNNAGPAQFLRNTHPLNVAVTHTHTHTQQPACLKFPSPQSRDYRSGQTTPHGWAKNLNQPQRNLNDFVLTLRPASTTQSRPANPKPNDTPHP